MSDAVQICSVSPEEIKLPARTYRNAGWTLPACSKDKPFTSVVIEAQMDQRKIYTEYDYKKAEVIPVPIPTAQIVADYFGNERLKQRGCFVIAVDEIPTEAQLVEARAAREAWLQALVAEGDQEFGRSRRPDQIPDFCKRAVKELGATREWAFQAPVQLEECPACGEMVKPGVAICRACGAILNRDKAALFGLVERNQEPLASTPARGKVKSGKEIGGI